MTEANLRVGPCLLLATKTGGVQLQVGEYSQLLTLQEAAALSETIERAAADALATQTFVRSQPDGLARMGGYLFGKA